MPHSATIKLDGKESNVLAFHYDFGRNIEENGRVATRVRKGLITITLHSDEPHKEAMLNWLAKPDQSKEGELIIYSDDEKKKIFKTIKFENAFIIEYSEDYAQGASSNVRETFTISSEKVTIGAAAFDFKWPKA